MGNILITRLFGALRSSQRAISFAATVVASAFPNRRSLRTAGGMAAVAGLAACGGDGLTSPANIENFTRVYSVFALTGTSPSLPAAYQFTSETLSRPQLLPSGNLNFDIAFDIGSDGLVRIYPARTIIPSLPLQAIVPSMGVQATSGSFAGLVRGPDRGYLTDSVVVATVGQTYAFEVRTSGCIYQQSYYAKLAIDSVIIPERRIVVRSLVNRNCGFRSLAEGLPAN